MEQVNVKADNVAARFVHAAVAKADNAALRRSVNGKLIAVVTFQINGVDVPFAAIAQQMANELVAQADHLANVRAEQMIVDSGLGPALHELASMRLAVRRVLQTVREVAPDGRTVETV